MMRVKLGTLMEKIFKFTGIAWIVKQIVGEDCGCEERRDKLDNFKFKRK